MMRKLGCGKKEKMMKPYKNLLVSVIGLADFVLLMLILAMTW
jgi:hypothetical protein